MVATKNILKKYGNPSESSEYLFTLLKEMIEKRIKELNGSKSKLDQVRISALNLVLKTGLPNKKWKGWGHTELSWWKGVIFDAQKLTSVNFTQEIKLQLIKKFKFFIFIVNGKFSLSNLPKNISITDLENVEEKELKNILNNPRLKNNPFAQLNCGLAKTGFLLNVENEGCSDPVNIVYGQDTNIDGSSFHQTHNIYMLGPNSKLTVFERFWESIFLDDYHSSVGVEKQIASFRNTVSQSFLSEGAQLKKYTLGDGARNEMCKSINTEFIQQKKNSVSTLHRFYFAEGRECGVEGTIRNNIQIEFDETGAKCDVNAISMLSRKAHVDNNIIVQHNKGNNKSSQVFKGIYSDSSSGVFDSCVVVEKDAQNTQTIQKNDNILLSEKAAVNTNPQLEIFADDVECAHGSTIGQLDSSALFYLTSRGLSRETATNLLLSGFINDVIEGVSDENLKKELEDELVFILRLHNFRNE